jgi:hypothetical protein
VCWRALPTTAANDEDALCQTLTALSYVRRAAAAAGIGSVLPSADAAAVETTVALRTLAAYENR